MRYILAFILFGTSICSSHAEDLNIRTFGNGVAYVKSIVKDQSKCSLKDKLFFCLETTGGVTAQIFVSAEPVGLTIGVSNNNSLASFDADAYQPVLEQYVLPALKQAGLNQKAIDLCTTYNDKYGITSLKSKVELAARFSKYIVQCRTIADYPGLFGFKVIIINGN